MYGIFDEILCSFFFIIFSYNTGIRIERNYQLFWESQEARSLHYALNYTLLYHVLLGFDVYDDCGLAQKTMSQALDVLDGPILGTPSCTDGMQCHIGMFVPTFTVLSPYIKQT